MCTVVVDLMQNASQVQLVAFVIYRLLAVASHAGGANVAGFMCLPQMHMKQPGKLAGQVSGCCVAACHDKYVPWHLHGTVSRKHAGSTLAHFSGLISGCHMRTACD